MEYKIKKGDTLSAIAAANGTTVSALASANGIKNPNLIYAGDTLVIPDAAVKTSAPLKTNAVSDAPKATVSNTPVSSTAKTTPAYETGKPVFSQSSASKAAYDALKAKEAEKAPEYTSKYEERIAALLDSIENRPAFEYDVMSDPFYRSIRDRYISDGRRAMRESAANASTLTGGYGNSYGTTAASEAYGRYMTGLSDIIPSLYEAALKRYENEGAGMLDRLGMYRGLEGDDYERYRDSVADYNSELDYLMSIYDTLYDNDRDVFESTLRQWNADRTYGRNVDESERDYAYKLSRDAAEDAYRNERDAVQDAFRERELALKTSGASDKGPSSSSSSKSSSKTSSSSSKSSKGSSASDTFGYNDLSDVGKQIVRQISLTVPDKTGRSYDAMLESLKVAKKSGDITSKEYNYIKKLIG